MSSIATFVGLDYHQDGVQVCVLDAKGKLLVNRNVANDAAAIRRMVVRHGRPVRVAAEACCGAANLAQELADRFQWPTELAHPGYVARMKGSPDKSDFSDAHLLADLVRVNYLPKVWLAPESIRQLRRLVRHRQQLVARRRDLKLRIRGVLRENRLKYTEVRPWTKAWLGWLRHEAKLSAIDRWIVDDHVVELESLNQRVRTVEQRIEEATADDPVVARLLTLHSVGMVTAVTLRAEIGDFSRFNTGKQLSRFCGVSPRNASSGHRQADAGLIKAGNPQLRAVLIELAHRLMMRDNPWSQKGRALLKRGKKTNVAVAAVANRWVRWLHHEMRRPAPAIVPADEHPPLGLDKRRRAPLVPTIASALLG